MLFALDSVLALELESVARELSAVNGRNDSVAVEHAISLTIAMPLCYHRLSSSDVWSLLIRIIYVATAGGCGDRDDRVEAISK
ncbi:hypothetical protein Y032_0002g772 [Ancylostoma ceylanicum]|uniref:Uncharacterized protein n=1 Tax=Ancylostoma ceylanicum TaxID=53326 RepID=A0A016W162_9BILA|nr:hypothetical protein Y032_0002g772 [Ancylostoma ceylanicum]